MTLTDISQILPNACIVDFLDCKVIVDKNRQEIGYWNNGFYLNENYEFGYEVYKRILGNGIYPDGFYNNQAIMSRGF